MGRGLEVPGYGSRVRGPGSWVVCHRWVILGRRFKEAKHSFCAGSCLNLL